MKIQSSNTKTVYQFDPGGKNEERHICPECSHLRRKKTDKCFAWDNVNNRGYCHNCNTAFFEYRPYEPKQYIVPEWKNKTDLTDKAVKYFEGRMISQKTLNKMRIYSDKEFMPQFGKEVEVICFPYLYNGNIVNIKFRGANKSFKLVSGAELILWNIDCLKDNKEVIITEGEIDALTFIEAGFDNVVSVPNGANKNLEYLDNYIEFFNPIAKIHIATDQDTKGIELRDELIRRFGPEKCYIVSFKDCKDANEYILKYGSLIKDVIKDSIPVPIKGIVDVENIYQDVRDLFENGIQPGKSINFDELDQNITWETKRLAIITGVPGMGKSEFVDFIVAKLNIIHGWKAAYFTPENYPLKFHYAKLFEKIIGSSFSKIDSSNTEFDTAYEYIKENFFYILNEEDFKVESILNSAKILIKTRGIKILVIDPYNKLEHKYTDSETQYISRFLDQLIMFAKINDILLFLIAHPRKMERDKDDIIKTPSLYDISGSANFYNKTDYGITIHRKSDTMTKLFLNEVWIHIQKVKYKHLGKQAVIELRYDYKNGRFNNYKDLDKDNWLTKGEVHEHELFKGDDSCPF
jgi:twinkle protein